MNLYKSAPRTGAKPKKVSTIHKLAARFGSVRLPLRSYSVFDALLEQQKAQYGEDYGLATRPPVEAMGMSLGAQAVTPPSTQEMESIVAKSNFASRVDIARQSSGMAAMETPIGPGSSRGAALFNQYAMTPRRAMAAAPRTAANITQSAAVVNLNLDALQPSLAQTLGSGMLSQQQLQAASYSNVYSLIKPGRASEADRQKATILLQRMILEGYVRGVDVARFFKEKGGLSYSVGSPRCGLSCGGTTSTGQPFVDMNNDGHYGSDIGFLNIFYQEVGHAMGLLTHTRGLMAGSYQYKDLKGQTVANYSKWLDWFFQDIGGTSRMSSYKFQPTRGLDANQVNQIIQQNQGWFPTVTGADPNGGVTPNPDGTTTTNTTNTVNNYNTFVPPTVNPGAGGQTFIGDSTVESGRTQTGNTPVQGGGPGSEEGTAASLRSFAAGLRDEKSSPRTTLAGLAGALARFKSG